MGGGGVDGTAWTDHWMQAQTHGETLLRQQRLFSAVHLGLIKAEQHCFFFPGCKWFYLLKKKEKKKRNQYLRVAEIRVGCREREQSDILCVNK